ncbi:HAD-IA family hydrolase [Haloferula sp.]|uniref:HAD-IA family hydrolase n=1 Tax=Haloferula sp. TaxID=2497595 RepID=UPI003C73A3C6
MIQGILFDAAGTLIEPTEPVAETYARLLSPYLGPLDPAVLSPRFKRAFMAAGDPAYEGASRGDWAERQWWRKVVEGTLEREISDEAFHAVFDHYADGEAWRVYPEVEDVLDACSQLGLRCAIVSNFDLRLHRILDDLDLRPRFDTVISSADASARKPSAAIFSMALSDLGLRADQVLHVGDSLQSDLHGARAAGIEAFHLKRPAENLRCFMNWAGNRLES